MFKRETHVFLLHIICRTPRKRVIQKHLMHQYHITVIAGKLTKLFLTLYASLVKSFISLGVLIYDIALKNTNCIMSEHIASLAPLLNVAPYAGTVVLCIAICVAIKIPCYACVEILFSALPLFDKKCVSMLTMSG